MMNRWMYGNEGVCDVGGEGKETLEKACVHRKIYCRSQCNSQYQREKRKKKY